MFAFFGQGKIVQIELLKPATHVRLCKTVMPVETFMEACAWLLSSVIRTKRIRKFVFFPSFWLHGLTDIQNRACCYFWSHILSWSPCVRSETSLRYGYFKKGLVTNGEKTKGLVRFAEAPFMHKSHVKMNMSWIILDVRWTKYIINDAAAAVDWTEREWPALRLILP